MTYADLFRPLRFEQSRDRPGDRSSRASTTRSTRIRRSFRSTSSLTPPPTARSTMCWGGSTTSARGSSSSAPFSQARAIKLVFDDRPVICAVVEQRGDLLTKPAMSHVMLEASVPVLLDVEHRWPEGQGHQIDGVGRRKARANAPTARLQSSRCSRRSSAGWRWCGVRRTMRRLMRFRCSQVSNSLPLRAGDVTTICPSSANAFAVRRPRSSGCPRRTRQANVCRYRRW